MLFFFKPFSADQSDGDAPWEVQLTASVMQFLCLLHNQRPRDSLWKSPDFLRSLASIVYPVEISEVCCVTVIRSHCLHVVISMV